MSANEISLIDVLKSENEDVIVTIQLNMKLEKVKEYIDILDGREKKEKMQRKIAKELGISRIGKRAMMKMFHEFYCVREGEAEEEKIS